MNTRKPIALLDPSPRTMELMFRPAQLEELMSLVELRPAPGESDYQEPTPARIEEILPEATYVIGQTDLPAGRLQTAQSLRAIVNVESNFMPNVDYEYCFSHHIHVLSVSPVFARAVAEIGLGFALALARQIPRADHEFRTGVERYGLEGNEDALLLSELPIGIIGFGDLGKALIRLLRPFGRRIRVFDPWLPERTIRDGGGEPSSLDEVLSGSRAIFVVAAVTGDNQGFLDRAALEKIPHDSLFVLLSRAGVVDFEALADLALSGSLRVATDVWPDEPFDPGHRIRTAPRAVLSAHRAGALSSCFFEMGDRVIEDIRLLNAGLPPVSCKRGEYETVSRMRSRPVTQN